MEIGLKGCIFFFFLVDMYSALFYKYNFKEEAMIGGVGGVDGSNDALKNRFIDMVNASGRAVTENIKSEAKIKEEIVREHNDNERKKLESELRDLSKKLNNEMRRMGTDLNFSFNENIPGLVVTVSERDGGKIIREIPSREAIELMKKMRDIIGVIFDKQG